MFCMTRDWDQEGHKTSWSWNENIRLTSARVLQNVDAQVCFMREKVKRKNIS